MSPGDIVIFHGHEHLVVVDLGDKIIVTRVLPGVVTQVSAVPRSLLFDEDPE